MAFGLFGITKTKLKNDLAAAKGQLDSTKLALADTSGQLADANTKIANISSTQSEMPSIGDISKGSSGIIGSAMGYDPTKANSGSIGSANTYEAKLGSVGSNQLVSNQLDGLLAGDSQYIKRAQDLSKMQSNSRGLINSTMAAQSGTAAAIDAALPIAQQDAATHSNQSLVNQSAQNQAAQFNTGEQNTNQRLRYTTEADTSRFNADASNQAGRFNAESQNNRDDLRYQTDANMSQFNAGQQNARDDLTFTSEVQNNQFNAGMNFDQLRLDQDKLLSNLDVAAKTGATITTNFMDNWTALMTSDVDGKDEKGQQLMAEAFGQLSMIGKMTGQEDSISEYIDNIYSQTSGERPQLDSTKPGVAQITKPAAKEPDYISQGYVKKDKVPSNGYSASQGPDKIIVGGVPYKKQGVGRGSIYLKVTS